jgi:hypothetical protein
MHMLNEWWLESELAARHTSPVLQSVIMVITRITRILAPPTATTELIGSPAGYSSGPVHGSTRISGSMASILADTSATAGLVAADTTADADSPGGLDSQDGQALLDARALPNAAR